MKGKQGGKYHRTGKLFTLILTIVFTSSLLPMMKLKAIDADTYTLTIDFSYDDKPIDGAELENIQAGKVKLDESRNISFEPAESFKDIITDGFDAENIFGAAAGHSFFADADSRAHTDVALSHALLVEKRQTEFFGWPSF